MGSLLFNKNAGKSIYEENKTSSEKTDIILAHLKKYDLIPENMTGSFDGNTLIIEGEVASEQEKNKILATAGNVKGIAEIEDRITVAGQVTAGSGWGANPENTNAPSAETDETKAFNIEESKQFYTVKKGDYLSRISKAVYGDGNKYNIIFEANKPMLKDASLIYPGQVLVIPALPE